MATLNRSWRCWRPTSNGGASNGATCGGGLLLLDMVLRRLVKSSKIDDPGPASNQDWRSPTPKPTSSLPMRSASSSPSAGKSAAPTKSIVDSRRSSCATAWCTTCRTTGKWEARAEAADGIAERCGQRRLETDIDQGASAIKCRLTASTAIPPNCEVQQSSGPSSKALSRCSPAAPTFHPTGRPSRSRSPSSAKRP
jgi:hypothetical protein